MNVNFIPKRVLALAALAAILSSSVVYAGKPSVQLRVLDTYDHGGFLTGASEIVAFDPESVRLFVVNGGNSSIDVLDASEPSDLSFLFAIDVSQGPDFQANSVDVCDGIVAAAIQNDVKTSPGTIKFFDADGNLLNSVAAGALPDMLTFTPNCDRVLVANEGEPNSYGQPDSVDPEGSVTIVDLRKGVANATTQNVVFTSFNGSVPTGVRIFGPGATVAQDLEPEYIAVDHNSKTAYVTLQENNAVAVIDIATATITAIKPLGFKDHNAFGNGLDASDRDVPGSSNSGVFNVRNWPVFGMYQPDAISAYKYGNQTFLVTANEGDARDYIGFNEEVSAGSRVLDPGAFPGFDVGTGLTGLRNNDNLGRLNVTSTLGNTDADPEYEALYSFGARSFTIWSESGELIFDSGDALEQITYAANPLFFNSNHEANNFDNRSDNKGPEPEAVTVGKAYGRTYVFVGLERVGGVVVYDVTDPFDVRYVQYINNRDFTAAANTSAAGDLGPEGIHFISEDDSPTGVPMIAVANEVSGTTTLYEFVQVK